MEPMKNLLATIAGKTAARKEWEAANPEVAAAWREALLEDEARTLAAEEARERKAREAHLRQVAPNRLLAAGAPRRAVECWEAGLGRTKALEAAEAAWREGKSFLLLKGGTGVGKTSAAVAAMAMELLRDRRDDLPCLFVRAAEAARLGLYDAADKKLAAQMATATVLVVDDIGADFVSKGGVWASILDEVMDTRYGERLLTIITTNLDSATFKERYGERIADRIRHAGDVVECGAGSLRAPGEG